MFSWFDIFRILSYLFSRYFTLLCVDGCGYIVSDFCRQFHLDNYSDEHLAALCGLQRWTFMYVYSKYCGPATPIKTHEQLFRCFQYLKQYPLDRCLSAFRFPCIRVLKSRIKYLAQVLNELEAVWATRHDDFNRIPHHFRDKLVGSIDTFPILVSRPTHSIKQSILYNGKYKHHVYKVHHTMIYNAQLTHTHTHMHTHTTKNFVIYRNYSNIFVILMYIYMLVSRYVSSQWNTLLYLWSSYWCYE